MTWIFLPVQTMAQYTILGECLICFDFLIQIAMHVVFGYKSRMGEDAPLHTFLGHSKVSNTEILKRQLFLYRDKSILNNLDSTFNHHSPAITPSNIISVLREGKFPIPNSQDFQVLFPRELLAWHGMDEQGFYLPAGTI